MAEGGGGQSWYQRNREKALASSRARYEANKEKYRALAKKYYAKKDKEKEREYKTKWRARNQARVLQNCLKIYGISVVKFAHMLNEQNGRCAICNNLPKEGQRLSVDHNHKSMKIRALVCRNCNSALGMVNENTSIMRSMIAYVEAHNG